MSTLNLYHLRHVLRTTYKQVTPCEYYHLKRSELRKLTEEEKEYAVAQKYLYRNRRGLFSISVEGFKFMDEKEIEEDSEIGRLNFINAVHRLAEFWLDYLTGKFRYKRAHSNFYRNFVNLGLLYRVCALNKGEGGFALTELGVSELTKLGLKLPPTEKKTAMKMYPKRKKHKNQIENL